MKRKTEIFGSKSELVKAVADRIVLVASEAIGERNVCSIALAGGNTPRDVYALLSSDSYKDRVDWEQVQLFWGDERTVPPDHSDSNFRMAREAFIDRI
ncbi:6-phosphogluconolactonase, partial [candidate division KSB1 bacterium]|nr:6-phosphogluconolactonase [candidate division KSB1 bacterium]NIR70672.1 6-phosphogluconolactonase [candidate division KSB1 bacterium]NIS26024.1 6-phosphogluconolactonase [candidate division KSB1 bacterium]NIT72848.1 6-phosphogluconolactonase [candidate division KSB1 bacterium]NIU26689.1 6-phosphogluconolactonase [candidate division KSB1 bacterium]